MAGTLVTGASGFVGGRLLRRLSSAGAEVWGLARRPQASPPALPAERWIRADLRDREAVIAAVQRAAPERIFHLGALASPRACDRAPDEARASNVAGTAAILEGAQAVGARVLLASSSQVYGRVEGHIDEHHPLDPVTVYGQTKLEAENLARDYAARGLPVVIARPFNHSGPGQTTDYVLPALVEQVRVAAAKGVPIRTGNLFPRRDFLHVDDVLDAYELLIERGQAGEAYNVCRGEGLTIGEALHGIQRRLGAADQRTEEDPERVRSQDPSEVVGVAAKLAALGWSPKVGLESLLDDIAKPAL
ncbi:NAD-dependent epimerase/dehydratase family protein [Engelhardtia mirabilis]|uniref:GDP-6-deoxy-D-mannose reductase n=1 Tax=Engelhardtia mirabilis TaxID=2528011 RepID=A0A518BKA2_9BACT|nr:GDP-6-deoxy-D-mannose reductase [Planctomycetes bacterium Pla133]QDV01727.1 GDP-6-deoxy-D-mannose reductase [Planctomycetes bacterium Pla86]